METLIQEIPEVVGDKPEEEVLRAEGIEKVRNMIAKRWLAMRTIASNWHADERETALVVTRDTIDKLLKIYGDHFEFGPPGDYFHPMPGVSSADVCKANLEMEESTSSKSSSSVSLPHQFLFLQTLRRGDVWTCMKVP